MREALSWTITDIHAQGWARGTGGNFSAVRRRQPLTLLMAPSSVDKGLIEPDTLIEVNEAAQVVAGNGRASAETLLHVAIVQATGANAVLHTHSVFGTLLSAYYAPRGEIVFSGYEMLKGLENIQSHETRVSLPVLPNSQNMAQLSQQVRDMLQRHPDLHGLMLAGHGLYTWGESLFQARRHVEILEFFFELTYQRLMLIPPHRRG
ncbi:MAG: methylthioribulose 1-phosphate dehydratase [Leptolyngbya sp. SIO4C1]|nr:methylthioribulose 1-phosphate dehydratase [Leptolyngbya sp. SIO4C1]